MQVLSTVPAPNALDPVNLEAKVQSFKDLRQDYIGFHVDTLQFRASDNIRAAGLWRENAVLRGDLPGQPVEVMDQVVRHQIVVLPDLLRDGHNLALDCGVLRLPHSLDQLRRSRTPSSADSMQIEIRGLLCLLKQVQQVQM